MGWGQNMLPPAIAKLASVLVFAAHCCSTPTRGTSNAKGFVSIDCGAPGPYDDDILSLPYEADSVYVETGENKNISLQYKGTHSRRAENLRIFPNGKRNCYTIDLEKDNKYLIRASFMYGNYDGKDEVPIFDLYLGVDKWNTVNLTNSSTYEYYDIIHYVITDYIDVCLVSIGQGTPFISALKVRPLDNALYQRQEAEIGSLDVMERWDVGAAQDDGSVRYPYDTFDRIWHPKWDPEHFPSWKPSNTDLSTNKNDEYKVPDAVLSSAARTNNATTPLRFFWSPENASSRFYFYFYFCEIEELPQGRKRKIHINLNNGQFEDTFMLEYLEAKTIPSLDPVSGAEINFIISAADNSEYPPILNALEIFEIKEIKGQLTAQSDVYAIRDIKKNYKIRRDTWQGDPCAPVEFKWEGLNCNNNDGPPRIISINLNSSNLSGELHRSFSELTELETLDLSYNELSGTIPDFLANLPKLRILNLTGNNFRGTVPKPLRDNYNLQLSVGENPSLCKNDDCHESMPVKKYVIPIVAGVLLLGILSTALAVLRRLKRRKERERSIGFTTKMSLISRGRRFSFSEVVKITNEFKDNIGEGGFGKVYKGILDDNTEVAVKMPSATSSQGVKEFQAEAQILLTVHHRNLVPLVGYCDEGKNKGLIYEYMPNGNLQQYLSDSNPNVLNWHGRLQIALEAAQGLEYLHNGCMPAIIHRDLKPTNILLDKEMQAKIADFGLSRVFKTDNECHFSTKLAGTPGYVDPEYQVSGNLNKKSDVYSFGIILLELITGRPALVRGPSGSVHIPQWVRPMIEKGAIESIVDPRLQGEFNVNSARKAVEVAMSCEAPMAIQRPDMSEVLAELKECLAMEMMTPGRTLERGSSMTQQSNRIQSFEARITRSSEC